MQDLDWLVQFIGFGFVSLLAVWFLVKKTAYWYFNFDSSDYYSSRKQEENNSTMDSCAVCGLTTTKQCSSCKMVKYCSGACQQSHWNSDHKAKCRELKSSYKANHGNSTSVARGRRGFFRKGSSKMLVPANKVLFPYEDFVGLFNYHRLGSYPPCGLINCGNSCFANVVLQCFAYTRPLVAYLLEKHQNECNSLNWCFFCEFQKHVEKASQSFRPFSPINILSKLPDISANFGSGKQEDAHEFMRFAIDNMQSVCLDDFGGEKAVLPSSQETTLIQHIFGGRLQSQVVCTKCNNVSNQFENMMDLTVEIHGDAESLEECLDQFTAEEQLHGDNMYKCDGCNAYVKAWKRLLIHRAPNILTIALKRFQSGRFGKLNKKVSFPETLDLRPYKIEPEDGNDIYKLYAVIVHVDMLNASFFGHYICYVKDFRGSWFRVDDCKVESVDLDEVLSQGAYMLLYSRNCVRPSCLLPHETLRKEENKNLKIQEPAESSSLASERLDNTTVDPEQSSSLVSEHPDNTTVDPEQSSSLVSECPDNTTVDPEQSSSLVSERPDNTTVYPEQPSSILEINISDTEVENRDNSEPNMPVIKDVELDQGEDLSTTSSMEIDTNQPDVQDKSLEESNASESCKFEERKNVCSAEFSSPMDVEDSSRGSTVDAGEKLAEESHATNSGIFEEDKSTCNDFFPSVITNGEMNSANTICAYKNASLENGSTSSGDIQDAITKSDLRNSAAKLKQNANLSNGSTSSHGSAVKLKPIFAPGFLVKRTRKEVTKPGNVR